MSQSYKIRSAYKYDEAEIARHNRMPGYIERCTATATMRLRQYEEDALKRVVSRYYQVDNPFDVVNRCYWECKRSGERLLTDKVTEEVIIEFFRLKTDYREGMINVAIRYRTFDGLQ